MQQLRSIRVQRFKEIFLKSCPKKMFQKFEISFKNVCVDCVKLNFVRRVLHLYLKIVQKGFLSTGISTVVSRVFGKKGFITGTAAAIGVI